MSITTTSCNSTIYDFGCDSDDDDGVVVDQALQRMMTRSINNNIHTMNATQDEDNVDSTTTTMMLMREKYVTVVFLKIFGFLSMIGSMYVIYTIVGISKTNRKQKLYSKRRPFHRVLLILSVGDILQSFSLFLSTWMIPKEPPTIPIPTSTTSTTSTTPSSMTTASSSTSNSNVIFYEEFYVSYFPWAAGNDTTCNVQGFLINLGTTISVFCSGFLAFQYVLLVRYNCWKEQRTRSTILVVESIFYVILSIWAACSSIYLLLHDYYHPTFNMFCWINEYPLPICSEEEYYYYYYHHHNDIGIKNYDNENNGYNTTTNTTATTATTTIQSFCESHPDYVDQSDVVFYRTIFAGVPIMTSFIVVVPSMILLYLTVREQEQRARRWRTMTSADLSRVERRRNRTGNGNGDNSNRRRSQGSSSNDWGYSQRVIRKAMLVISVYLWVYIPSLLSAVVFTTNVRFGYVSNIFFSMQGLLNALVLSSDNWLPSMMCCCCKWWHGNWWLWWYYCCSNKKNNDNEAGDDDYENGDDNNDDDNVGGDGFGGDNGTTTTTTTNTIPKENTGKNNKKDKMNRQRECIMNNVMTTAESLTERTPTITESSYL